MRKTITADRSTDPMVKNAITIRTIKRKQAMLGLGAKILGTTAILSIPLVLASLGKKTVPPLTMEQQLADLNRPKGKDGLSHESDERGRIAESTEMPHTHAFVLGVKKQ